MLFINNNAAELRYNIKWMEYSENILTVEHLKKSYKVSSGAIDVLINYI